MNRRYHRQAFSLIELLVVIAIMTILISLSLPAVQKVREASRNTVHQNNMRQILLAAASHQSETGKYPFNWGYSYSTDPLVQKGAYYQLLPHLGEKAIYDQAVTTGVLQKLTYPAQGQAGVISTLSTLPAGKIEYQTWKIGATRIKPYTAPNDPSLNDAYWENPPKDDYTPSPTSYVYTGFIDNPDLLVSGASHQLMLTQIYGVCRTKAIPSSYTCLESTRVGWNLDSNVVRWAATADQCGSVCSKTGPNPWYNIADGESGCSGTEPCDPNYCDCNKTACIGWTPVVPNRLGKQYRDLRFTPYDWQNRPILDGCNLYSAQSYTKIGTLYVGMYDGSVHSLTPDANSNIPNGDTILGVLQSSDASRVMPGAVNW